MRKRIVSDLQLYAMDTVHTGHVKWLVFDDRFHAVDGLSGFGLDGFDSKVQIGKDVVFKRYSPSVSDFSGWVKNDKYLGFQGGYAEALNTLVANRRSVPSHSLLALGRVGWKGEIVLAFSRLLGFASADQILVEGNRPEIISGVFNLFSKALEKGIYHVDPNSSNVMISLASMEFKFIDFECVLPCSCPARQAFLMQAASFYDWRVRDLVGENEYKELLLLHLAKLDPSSDGEPDLSWFDRYNLPHVGRVLRQERLVAAGGEYPDMSKLLANGR